MGRTCLAWLPRLILVAVVVLPAAPRGPLAEVSRAQEIRARVFKLLNDGIQAHKEGRQKDAIRLLREASDIGLNSFRAYYYLGLALKADRQYQAAIEPLEISLELDPVNLQARVALGDCYLKQGDPVEALAEYHRALKLQADYAPAHDGLGRAAEASGDDEQAILHYRKAIELNPGFPDAALNLGDLFMREGRHNEAIELFLRAIKVRPDFAAAYNRLGVAYARQRLENEAIAALRQAQTLEKGNPWHPVTIGGIFLDQDNLVQARREFDRALELDADFLEAYLAYAGLLRRECDFTAAIEMIEKGLRRDVDDAPTLAQLREKKEKLESEAALAAEIQARLDAGPRTAADLSALADLKASVGDFESSVRLLQEAGETPEGDVAPADAGPARLERLGYGALRAGMYAEAAEAYARVAQLEPGRAEILINLGLARMGLGDRDGAEESLREASRLRPGDPTPFACLGNLYATSGRRDLAVASLDTALTLMAEGAEERQRVERLLRHLKSPGAQGS